MEEHTVEVGESSSRGQEVVPDISQTDRVDDGKEEEQEEEVAQPSAARTLTPEELDFFTKSPPASTSPVPNELELSRELGDLTVDDPVPADSPVATDAPTTVEPVVQPKKEEETVQEYILKEVFLNGKRRKIMTQNENGPCPLIAVVNALVYRGVVSFAASAFKVTSSDVISMVTEEVFKVKERQTGRQNEAVVDANVEAALNTLFASTKGIDMNPRFRSIDDFEFTEAHAFFDVLGLKVVHGWIADNFLLDVLRNRGYNELSVIAATGNDEEATLIREFLEETSSQLTATGLEELKKVLKEGDVVILFRNNHFHNLFIHRGTLFTLITDQGFLSLPHIVFESLVNTQGDSNFYNGSFERIREGENIASEEAVRAVMNAEMKEQESEDYAFALRLQEEEELSRARAERAHPSQQAVSGPSSPARFPFSSTPPTSQPQQQQQQRRSSKKAMSSPPVCRYFASGQCQFGSSCTYLHDRSALPPMVCRFNDRGSCVFGTACRYDHVRPKKKKEDKPSPALKTKAKPPKPVSIVNKTHLNADAPEFIPSWLKKEPLAPGSSYAQAAGSSSEDAIVYLALCPYHELGNCPKDDDCEYAHGEKCDMCGKNILHPIDESQRARHIAECSQEHEQQMELAFLEQRSREMNCGICMEAIYDKNLRFGVLENCKHCFCVNCIREWRKKTNDYQKTTVRSCPECRQHSDFVVPSVVWIEDKEEKEILFAMYRENAKKKPCKYYVPYSTGDCPFGSCCFYKHINPDGTPAAEERPGQKRKKVLLSDFLGGGVDSDDYDDEEFDEVQQAMRGTGFSLERLRMILQRITFTDDL